MNNFELNMINKGIISNQYKPINDHKLVISGNSSSPKLHSTSANFYKSRTHKTKRFNSTNARYKNVVNKIEKDRKSLRQIRKWSQGRTHL